MINSPKSWSQRKTKKREKTRKNGKNVARNTHSFGSTTSVLNTRTSHGYNYRTRQQALHNLGVTTSWAAFLHERETQQNQCNEKSDVTLYPILRFRQGITTRKMPKIPFFCLDKRAYGGRSEGGRFEGVSRTAVCVSVLEPRCEGATRKSNLELTPFRKHTAAYDECCSTLLPVKRPCSHNEQSPSAL